ncbi:MAG TPA: hypothetical protein VF131_24235 [Blastocatellia bacterium]|nr:hypothetical protein [Blastocatellia bacterium]
MEQVVSFLFKYKAALFSKSQFGFGARPSVLVLLVIAVGLALLVYFLYVRHPVRLTLGWRVLLIGLRLALVALILFCLMRPVIVVPTVVAQSSYVAVLMDDSKSMQLADEGDQSRLETVKRLMAAESGFHTALADKFKVRAFKFSEIAERVESAAELAGEGEQTDIVGALERAVRDSSGLPLSGLIVMSDGATNGEADLTNSMATALGNLRARGLPVFTVGVGQTRLEGDVEVIRATAPRRVLRGSPVTAEVLLRADASQQRSVRVELSEDSHALRTQDVPIQTEATTVARITFTPSSPGLHRYTFTVPPTESEVVAENNSQELLIEVVDARPKILYIEGEPRWEYGKIRAALADEKNVALVSVLRSADGKYYRQGVESGDELAAGFPKSEEELFRYDALVLGSAEATFFTFDQLRAIEQFVSRRGGTLLALAGPKAFGAGGYSNTPIADLLPVYIESENALAGESQNFKAEPSSRGRDNPAARLAEQPEQNQKAWADMPAITLPEVITNTKPGASVILDARSVKDKNRVVPLLVEERYGRGRTLALLASDTWRWRMMLESKNRSFETFWTNLLRYTVDSVRHKVEAATDRSFYGRGEQVRVRVEVADEKYNNIADARVGARVTTPTGRTIDIVLKPAIEGGFEGYIGTLAAEEDGLHKVEVTTRSDASGASGFAEASFLVGPLNREARDAAQNRELLKRIAAETGGQYYSPANAVDLVEDLTHTEGPNSMRETRDLWDMPINFLLLVALAAAEWFVRKRKGLA